MTTLGCFRRSTCHFVSRDSTRFHWIPPGIGLITRRLPLEHWREAYEPAPGDIKTVLVFGPSRRQATTRGR